MQKSIKTLHIDASRLKSGGGIIHLIKLLELENIQNLIRSLFIHIKIVSLKSLKVKKLLSKHILYK